MGKFALEIEGLSFAYGRNDVLRNINLKLREGEFLAMVGPNGGGKTTLLKLLLGLLCPQQGKIKVFGRPQTEEIVSMAYVPQTTEKNKDFPMTVSEVVMMGRMKPGIWGRRFQEQDFREAETVMETLGIWKYRDTRIGNLSVGERKRVFIARALVSNPKILFLDEPAASMDVEGQTRLYHLLKELNESVTIVNVTHDLGVLSKHVSCVACVNGELCFHEGSSMTHQMLEMAYGDDAEILIHGAPGRVMPFHSGHGHGHE